MKLTSLSASSALVAGNCWARFNAEYVERAPQPSGSPAAFGTACHQAAQEYVEDDYYLAGPSEGVMRALWDRAYYEHFADAERHQEGLDLMLRWMERTDFTGRTVLSTEQKYEFPIQTSIGEIPFRYIWDRCDRIDATGDVDVIDYKTWMTPVKPEGMKNKIQVRCYGLAAAIKHPDAARVWVTLDQFRFEPVATTFSRDENVATWNYLKALAERIIAQEPDDDGQYPETLNSECRYCVRRHQCGQIAAHEAVGGPLGITDAYAAAERRHRLESAIKAMYQMRDELDEVILGHCRAQDVFEFSTGAVEVNVTASSRRVIDPAVAARIIGPDVASQFPGGIGVGTVDKLVKGDLLTNEQKSQLKQAVRREFGEARIKTVESDPTTTPVVV